MCQKSIEGDEFMVILTAGPLGPGNPMLPGSPLAPAGPIGPGLPSIPGRPWNQSLFKLYSASIGSHNLKFWCCHMMKQSFSGCTDASCIKCNKLWISFLFLNKMLVYTQPSQFHKYTIPFPPLFPYPCHLLQFSLPCVSFSFFRFSPAFIWTP